MRFVREAVTSEGAQQFSVLYRCSVRSQDARSDGRRRGRRFELEPLARHSKLGGVGAKTEVFAAAEVGGEFGGSTAALAEALDVPVERGADAVTVEAKVCQLADQVVGMLRQLGFGFGHATPRPELEVSAMTWG